MGKMEIAIKSSCFTRFTCKLDTIVFCRKIYENLTTNIFRNFGASAEESKFSPDAKESDSPGALLRRFELCFTGP